MFNWSLALEALHDRAHAVEQAGGALVVLEGIGDGASAYVRDRLRCWHDREQLV